MKNFIPHVFIGIGQNGHFFTLRQTYQRVIGRGATVLSEHVQNLSQDRDEAYELAKKYAADNGMILKTELEELPENLNEIFKRKREAVAAEKRAAADRRLREAYERRQKQRELLNEGIVPFGNNSGKKFSEVPGFVRWVWGKRDEFDEDSILADMCRVIGERFPEYTLSEYADMHLIPAVGQRVTVSGVVQRVMTFQSDWGITRWVIIKDDHGVQVVAKGKWYTEEGKRVKVKGTIKEKGEYRGTKQTVINRVKEVVEND